MRRDRARPTDRLRWRDDRRPDGPFPLGRL